MSHVQQPAARRHRPIRTVRQAFHYVVARVPRGTNVTAYYSENCETGQPDVRSFTVEIVGRQGRGRADERTAARAVDAALRRYRASLASPLRLAV